MGASPLLGCVRGGCSGRELQNSLRGSSDEQVRCALQQLRSERPWLLEPEGRPFSTHSFAPVSYGRARKYSPETRQQVDHVELKEVSFEIAPEPSPTSREARERKALNTLQFASKVYFCQESDKSVLLRVLRIGDRSRSAEVRYSTKDGNARAGKNYQPVHGKLMFGPGDYIKDIEVELILNDKWDQTKSFLVELLDEGLYGAGLGQDMCRAIVFQIDDTAYPTAQCMRLLPQVELGQTGGMAACYLFLQLTLFLLRTKALRWRAFKSVLLDQVFNIMLLLQLYLTALLVDTVLTSNSPEMQSRWKGHLGLQQNYWSLVLLALFLNLLPLAILHPAEYWRTTRWRLNGPLLLRLQSSILRQFLHLAPEVRHDIQSSKLIQTMTVETQDLVKDGMLGLLQLPRHIGLLCFAPLFAILSDEEFRIWEFAPVLTAIGSAYGVAVVAVLLCRSSRMHAAMQEKRMALAEVQAQVFEVVHAYELILNCFKRNKYQQSYEEGMGRFNSADVSAKVVKSSNEFILEWVQGIAIVVFTVEGGRKVISGELSLGLFLAQLRLIDLCGKAFDAMSSILFDIQGTLPAAVQVISLMNLQNDYSLAGLSADFCQQETIRILSKQGDIDSIPIRVDLPGSGTLFPLELSGLIEIPQGSLVCITGAHGTGRTSLLRMVGGLHNRPTSVAKLIFVPSHIRTMYVDAKPLLLKGTLYFNLAFGTDSSSRDGSRKRVSRICQRIGFSDSFMQMLENDELHPWDFVLSRSECQLVTLARAFIANVEFLCINRPLEVLTLETAGKVLNLLDEYVRCRGVEEESDEFSSRRLRTCFISSFNPSVMAICDKTYEVVDGKVKLRSK